MRILYGVVGEGMGHAMRSGVVLDHLTKNHEVQVVVSGRAHDYLVKRASERLSGQEDLGPQHRLRGQRGLELPHRAREPEGRGHRHAEERARLLRHRREVRARRRDLRLRELELPVRQEPHDPGGVGRQHPDAHPLHARAGDPGRARERIPDREDGHQAEGRGGVPLPHHDVLLPASAQAAHDAGAADPAPADPRRRARRRAITCSSTRRRRRTRRCRRSWRARAASAASTGCGAI